MKKERKRMRAYRGLPVRLWALVLALWLLCSGMLTWAVAQDMRLQMENEVRNYCHAVDWSRKHSVTDNPEDLPGASETSLIGWMGYPYMFLDMNPLLPFQYEKNGVSSDEWLWGKWDLLYGFESAEAFYDEDGNLLMKSGDYLTFQYTSEENWKEENVEALGSAYIDLNATEGAAEIFGSLISDYPCYDRTVGDFFLHALRLTGYFEGNVFYPTQIDKAANIVRGSAEYIIEFDMDENHLCGFDAKDQLKWESIFTAQAPEDQKLVTIYGWDVGGYTYTEKPVTVNGTAFDSLADLLVTHRSAEESYEKDSLLESVTILGSRKTDDFGTFTYFIAVRYKPLQYAALRLIPFYLVSLAAVALCTWLLLRRVRKNLTDPVEELAERIECRLPIEPSASWKEIYELQHHIAQSHKALAETTNELNQVRTALEYSRNAEQSRRELVSGITHELKTPLAVIHSYAEGLQAGIAREKQEQYLSVILEETEKMDAMVLQMLDLSRLEAGKVRLAADQFSLLKLSETIVEKFRPMLEAKGLELCYDLAEDFCITADEARITQVITNLLSNALKYTLPGGQIRLKVYEHKAETHFHVENTCAPLSQEALTKVWDSFYRADPSRSEKGTGLGLTLVKQIVKLHRGDCFVRNTAFQTEDSVQTGVEFGFTLPLK